jgi:hypothetical protein
MVSAGLERGLGRSEGEGGERGGVVKVVLSEGFWENVVSAVRALREGLLESLVSALPARGALGGGVEGDWRLVTGLKAGETIVITGAAAAASLCWPIDPEAEETIVAEGSGSR